MHSTRFASPLSRARLLIAALAAAVLPATTLAAKPADVVEVVKSVQEEGPQYLRVESEKGEFVALEIAERRFAPRDGSGPTVSLVAVAHIGDRSYYRLLQDLLDQYEIVLYESVKPAGAGGAGGETDEQRIETTRAAMRFVAGLIADHHRLHQRYPADLDELRDFAHARDSRLGEFLDAAKTDAWGRTFSFELVSADGKATGYLLQSLGADGKPGGEGADADIVLDEPADATPLTESDGDSIQAELAGALNLAFQLDALDYDRANFRCSDMAIDQVERAMRERGSDFSLVEGTLAGTSLPAQIARFMLGLVRMADAFTGNAISDTIKVVLIEMLGDEALVDISLNQFDEGFAEVIIGERNQVVIDDLKQLMDQEPDAESVAVFYGAGHMADLAVRLAEQLDYAPTGEGRWLRAIEVDLAESSVTERDVNRIRLMVRQMMRQMSRMQQR